jgi:amino acid transporter/mannitol/fructose-specific phosphotransferase system IIA component (Ntr-type)
MTSDAKTPKIQSAGMSGDASGEMLSRELGLFGVFSIAAGAMISSGLFVLPGLAFAYAGPAVIVSYALASLLMIPVTLAKVELVTAMPRSGGSYFYIGRSLGPLAGAIAGFCNWISIALKSSFALVGIGALTAFVVPLPEPWEMRVSAIVACLFFTMLNLVGTRHAGRFQVALVVGLLAILCAYVFRGMPMVEGNRYLPFAPFGWQKVVMVSGMVFVSYGGLTKVVDVSEEVRNPTRNLPWGMALAFLVVSGLYIAVVFVTVGLVDAGSLAGSLVPIELGARPALGKVGVLLVEFAAFLAFATTANAGIMSASRSPMAMSRDGLLPPVISRTNRRFGTPDVAIGVTSLFMVSVIAFLSIEDLVKTASSMMLFVFMLDNLSVVVMRHSGLQNYRPTFRTPFCPWMQIIAIGVYVFLIFEMGTIPLVLTAAFAVLASAWYFLYAAKRADFDSALVFLVKNIVAADIGRTGLEDELRHITLERDEVSQDRFDRLVQEGVVLDIDRELKATQLFEMLAETLAPRAGLSRKALYERFLKREKEGHSVIRPGLAIPHVIVPGANLFQLALVRCKPGIVFSELNPPVTTAFVLVGSQDQRNYHLRALMNIAHVVQEEHFDERWNAAPDPQALKDIVLLSSRPRDTAT